MDVLITGANGVVGSALAEHLGDDYDLTLLDIEDGEDTDVVADVRDYDAVRPHFDGRDAVVHLALTPGTGGPDDRSLGWSKAQRDNLEGLHNVTEAAVDAGLDSLVFASSNHAVGMVEVRNEPGVYHNDPAGEADSDEAVRAGHDEPHRPDSRYGLTKCYGEDLGRLAAEAHDIRCYALRIGSVRAPEYDHPYGDAEAGVEAGRWERGSEAYEEQAARMKGLWLSRRDCARLVACCLDDDSVEWDHFYGVSGNDRRWLDDLAYARETVGYEPLDNGEAWDGPPE
ncbi:NAD-dependent epimerase/dehydratase family protein [Haloarcula onubensis]|uniref:NAD(P)-dependent oxidoreductase n=1 Tax=Haloarcula onubensis TaxID=2950539 RepID=A0ABU2FSE3_9EURY|nr:NAD(P)-dependent oxidoreductase [Halomicroarcula sp. S3CR25-11]MDS0283685.1 NAD(P)-dependent oxidoreductase [Halomicroarcula sp. S3CR25-11]